MNVQIKKLNDKAVVPVYATVHAAGADLYSTEFVILRPGEKRLFKTGLSAAIPSGVYGRIAPRSGLAFNWESTCSRELLTRITEEKLG